MKTALAVLVSLTTTVGMWLIGTFGIYVFLSQIISSRLELSWLGFDASLKDAALWISQVLGPGIGGGLGIVAAAWSFKSVKVSTVFRMQFCVSLVIFLVLAGVALTGLGTGK